MYPFLKIHSEVATGIVSRYYNSILCTSFPVKSIVSLNISPSSV